MRNGQVTLPTASVSFNPQSVTVAGIEDISELQPSPEEYLYLAPMWSPRGDYIAALRINAGFTHNLNDPALYQIVLVPVPELK